MHCIVFLALVGLAAAAPNDNFQGKFVFDLLKPALNSAEVLTILASRDGNQYPMYNSIPQTGFQCSSKAQPGFYADIDTQCQVFHRCDQAGNQTDYICVNGTIFNQITLVCDSWFNVECSRSIEYENFANARLYTNLPLFDTPPADYIAPSSAGNAAAASTAVPATVPTAAPKSASAARVTPRAAARTTKATTKTAVTAVPAARADVPGSLQVVSVDGVDAVDTPAQ